MRTKNNVEYKELNALIIKDIINHVRSPFVVSDRVLEYDENDELIDDFSPNEINGGTQEIINYLNEIKEYDLINEYNAFVVGLGYEAKEPKVNKITLRQAKLILNELGLLNSVKEFISQIQDEKQRARVEIEFEYANDIFKDNPLITTLAIALNLDNAKIDELFLKGSRL